VPSIRRPDLVPDFARRLAEALLLPFEPVLVRTEDRPEQKTMANSTQQARNVDGSVTVAPERVRGEPVLLVHVFAIGGNEHAAILTGIPVRWMKVSIYRFSAFTAGITGILMVGWLGSVTTNLGTAMELAVIAAAVIGGANLAGGEGTVFGAVVGALLIEVIRNSLILLGISTFWQGAFIGSFIIIAVGFDRIRRLSGQD
jgi:predicted ABC-type sugar transport system permease subunit